MKRTKEVKWDILDTKVLLDARPRLTVSVQKIKLPDGRIVDDYYRIEYPDAVIMIAVTPDMRVVMSRQYLHGFGRVSTVLPAGTVQKGEDRLEAAKRELLEETGYSSGDWVMLADPNSHTNYKGSKVSFYLAKNAVKTAEPDSDDYEEMEILLLNERQALEGIRNGEIESIASIAGLALAKMHFQEGK